MTEYMIVSAHNANWWKARDLLEEGVSALLEEGWEPIGSASVHAATDHDATIGSYWLWHQTLVRESISLPDPPVL